MGISHYIKEIGRGKDGARALSREHATDLFGQVLDGAVTDLEVGAFCLAMRIKGETPEEMAGFLDATRERTLLQGSADLLPVVLPSYNGARKLPVLTPLLALLLAQRGLPVLVHSAATDSVRVHAPTVLGLLGIAPGAAVAAGQVSLAPTDTLCPGLKRLLDVRRVVGLRNPAHSLVKLMNPCVGRALVVGSYTHPEYAVSMAQTFELVQADALLLRGTEGEPVADPRRAPQMDGFVAGQRQRLQDIQAGSLQQLPDLPAPDAEATARYTRAVLDGDLPVPAPLAAQVEHILQIHTQIHAQLQPAKATP
ncbi:DNA-binding protein YbiB [Hydrogenophaga defluvii]|uniref:DNA-binding protein YbiB n=1 Tax=Hydrogenophaga defluvii TaxID=249410 RepID=A0ABW2SI81_9BURK